MKSDERLYGFKSAGKGLLIHADVVEESAMEQIRAIKQHPAITGLVAIMPDVHAGAGCVIGFTGKFRGAVIPNIVGVDIGCGVMLYPLGKVDVDFEGLDEHIRSHVPMGFNSRRQPAELEKDTLDLCTLIKDRFYDRLGARMSTAPELQLGTLGGGNHFIEIDSDVAGNKYIAIHTGSRNFGLKVANYFQAQAKTITAEMSIDVPRGLEYLPMSAGGGEYMEWLKIAQLYAHINRETIVKEILRFFGEVFDIDKVIESVHNYISQRDHIIRKGAISAYSDQAVIIPLNMADGIIIGKGKSNKDYNFSAPHGAGRVYGRKDMMRRLNHGEYTMKQFEESMDGIYSTSVKTKTFDESKFAYKPVDAILKHINETVDIEEWLYPIYNLKSD